MVCSNTLFSGYCKDVNILYVKEKFVYFCQSGYIFNDMICLIFQKI